MQVNWAHFNLSNNAVPAASGFSGTALEAGVRGTGNLLFTATDTGGPGVYAVTASIDWTAVWSGTPTANGGTCVAVGSDSGALMFDEQQPCPAAEAVSIPIATAGLPDGRHVLAVSVSDAAGNTSPVLDQTVSTSNPQTTPNPSSRRALHARFVISWHWDGASTLLRSIRVTQLLARRAGRRPLRRQALPAAAGQRQGLAQGGQDASTAGRAAAESRPVAAHHRDRAAPPGRAHRRPDPRRREAQRPPPALTAPIDAGV